MPDEKERGRRKCEAPRLTPPCRLPEGKERVGCTWAMSGAHEGCSQGKSVRDREGSKHSTAATLERVDSEAAVLPQDFEDTVHARQLKALCRRVGRRMSRQGPGRSPSMGLTHLNAARPREKSSGVPHCGSSKILSDLVSHRRATRPSHRPSYFTVSLTRRTGGVVANSDSTSRCRHFEY